MSIQNNTYHLPVLLNESIHHLVDEPHGIYIDATFGGGGHSRGILEVLSPKGRLISFDQDKEALANTIEDKRFELINQNFSFINQQLSLLGFSQVDGILADLGVSSHQFDTDYRGFSTRFDGPLDMRMNTLQSLSAFQVVNEFSEKQLLGIFKNYGELNQAYRMVQELIHARNHKIIKTTNDLKQVYAYLPLNKVNKIMAQLFQAIRIEVNQELNVLEQFLSQTAQLIKPNGKLVVISYHSLEDRLVKNFLKAGNFSGNIEQDWVYGKYQTPFKSLKSKPLLPSETEMQQNSRSRSAKMRIGIKN